MFLIAITIIAVAIASMATSVAWNLFMSPVFKLPGINAFQAAAALWLATVAVFVWNNVLHIYMGHQPQPEEGKSGKHHSTRTGR